MKTERILVLGVGNILLKDEGVGVRVIEELENRYEFPENVRLLDGGTQGLWLLPTLQLVDRLIVVDAVLGGGEPGTIYRLERQDLSNSLRAKQSAHDSDLVEALNLCSLLDTGPRTVTVIGIEPADIQPFGLGLTEQVSEKLDEIVMSVVAELTSMDSPPQKKFEGKKAVW